MKKLLALLILLFSVTLPLAVTASSFTTTFGGSPVTPSQVAYASYSFSSSQNLYWPQFAAGQTNVAATFMNITTTASSVNISMPDATLQSVGYATIIFNAGSNSFNIVNYSGGAIATIAAGQTYYILENGNATQAGTWQTVQFGVGTGSASASALAGAGLQAVAGLLNVNLNGNTVSTNFTITSAGLAQMYVWTGGAGTITLPNPATVGNGFFFMFANNGSGSVVLSPSAGNIDGASTSTYAQTQSGFIFSNGSNWFSVGKGIQNTFSVTLLNLNVAGSSNVTETFSQAQNIIQVLTGALTANISVIVPATVQLYEVNNTTSGSYTLTVKTASGTGVVVPQGATSILYCDGTNVVNGFTASVTSTIALANGSATSPSLSFANYATTGMYAPASNTVGFTTNSNESLTLTSTASAVDYLNINASSASNPITLNANGTDTNIGIDLLPKGNGGVAIGTTTNPGYTLFSNSGTSVNTLGLKSFGSTFGTGLWMNNFPGGNGDNLYFQDNSATKWTMGLGNTASNLNFSLLDNAGSKYFFTANTGGSLVLGPNQNTYLDQNGNLSVGGSGNSYKLNVFQAGGSEAYFGSTGSNPSVVDIDNAAGSQGDTLRFLDAGTVKWSFDNTSSNVFSLTDHVGSKVFIGATTGGSLVLGANQNFSIDQSGNATTLTQAVGNSSTRVATTAFANPASTLSSSGYMELPSGGYIQWLNCTTSASGYSTCNLPTTFPNNIYQATVTVRTSSTFQDVCSWNPSGSSTSAISVACLNLSNAYAAISISIIAIGN